MSLATAAREAIYHGDLVDLHAEAVRTDDPVVLLDLLAHAFVRGVKLGAVEMGAQIIELRTTSTEAP
jgi:hypothetical protein